MWFTVWVDQHLALSLTFARDLSEVQMIEGLGIDPRHVVKQTFEEAENSAEWGSKPRVRVGELDGWAYAVEHFTQVGPKSLSRLSAISGEALALVYTQTISTFQCWTNGEYLSGFDLAAPQIRWGRDPHRFDTTIQQAGFLGPGVPDPPAMGARFLELTFGITIDLDLLERALPSVELA